METILKVEEAPLAIIPLSILLHPASPLLLPGRRSQVVGFVGGLGQLAVVSPRPRGPSYSKRHHSTSTVAPVNPEMGLAQWAGSTHRSSKQSQLRRHHHSESHALLEVWREGLRERLCSIFDISFHFGYYNYRKLV